MKTAWVLITIGGLLILDGTIRIILGLINGNPLIPVGGLLTGWLLGGWLLSRGLKRRKQVKINA